MKDLMWASKVCSQPRGLVVSWAASRAGDGARWANQGVIVGGRQQAGREEGEVLQCVLSPGNILPFPFSLRPNLDWNVQWERSCAGGMSAALQHFFLQTGSRRWSIHGNYTYFTGIIISQELGSEAVDDGGVLPITKNFFLSQTYWNDKVNCLP